MKSRGYGNIVIYWFNLNEICECIFPCFYSFLLLLSNTILWSTSPYKNHLSLSHTETKDYLHIQVHGYTTCTYKLVHNNSKPFSSFFLSYSAIKFSYGFKHIFIFLDSWEYFKMFFKDWAARSCERKRKNSVLFTTYLKKRKRILTYFIREKYHCNVQLTSCFTIWDWTISM